jgi:O-methyltransferase
MDTSFVAHVLSESDMISIEQGMNLYHLLTQVVLAGVPGDVVELGSHKGLTAVVLRKTLDQLDSDKALHVYDSFEGLPEVQAEDQPTTLTLGGLSTSPAMLEATFALFEVEPPVIHQGWFADTLPSELPDQIAFAHLDGDLYSSTLESLEHVYPRLSPGAVCVIDDYCDHEVHRTIAEALNRSPLNRRREITIIILDLLPGVKRACDEFFADKPEELSVLVAGHQCHAYIRKIG